MYSKTLKQHIDYNISIDSKLVTNLNKIHTHIT